MAWATSLSHSWDSWLGAGLVAWSLLFARMFDAVTDPIIGRISDHTDTRFGRIVVASLAATQARIGRAQVAALAAHAEQA